MTDAGFEPVDPEVWDSGQAMSIPGPNFRWAVQNGTGWTTGDIHLVGVPFCPDLLSHDQLGPADDLRGRVVRAFFWLLKPWKP